MCAPDTSLSSPKQKVLFKIKLFVWLFWATLFGRTRAMGGFGAPLRRNQFILLVFFLLQIQSLGLDIDSRPTAEVCATHTISPGPKGDDGEKGDPGEEGKHGKVGRMGPKGIKGELGDVGDQGNIGKTGPIGKKGDKGEKGLPGIPGGKGKAGTVCDCGRYRKVVGQLDISVARLKTSMKFVKNVIAGIRETEEKFYYLVQEEKNYRESLTHCRIRGGMLAMPKDEAANTLIADYVAKSGFFRVFIGVNDLEREGQYVFTDNTPLQNYSNWKEGEPSDPYGHEDCVEMLSSGRWNDTECHLTMYFVCEFVKKKK
ncbi:collectin-10 isoform X2 [Equus asinus]|uniref:Collectin subfamily member 10 n=1 Tax=Equus asinus TaxID=9793 RepID=A0A9L0JR10_EQUAS|nr:collectin-10 [Equus asinus]XP_046497654.1 collectin-10 [Equus quagga]